MVDMSEFENDNMVTDSQLKVIAGLVKKQIELEREVSDAEEALKTAKRKLRKVQEGDLIDALLAAGISEFKTDDGFGVSIKESMKASIPAKNKPAAINWLMDHELSSLVKEDVVVPFDKGETEKVSQMIGILEMHGIKDFSVKPSINTSQVKASLKEFMENGIDVPEELFGIYHHKQAIVEK